jgi:hypothetical protein
MLPKEHGAYGQLVFPLVTAFAVTGAARPSVLIAVAVVALFLAHEPLMVLRGHRGRREQATRTGRTYTAWMLCISVAAVTGVLALDAMPPDVRWTFLVPAVPALGLLMAIVRNREKTLAGESGGAIAFSAAAVPVCAAGGNLTAGIVIGIAYALLFVLGTLAVRVIVLRTRGGGNPQAEHRTRVAALSLAVFGTAAVVGGATDGVLPWIAVAAVLPGVLFASGLAAFPPSAAKLKRVGWSLVAVTAATAILLVAATY